jgi:hypothetical protein
MLWSYIDVALRDLNARVPCQFCQHTHAQALACQLGNEGSAPQMTSRVIDKAFE